MTLFSGRLLLVPSLVLALPLRAELSDFDRLDQIIRANKAQMSSNTGTAVAVIQGDKVVYEGYFGYADIEKKLAVERDTVFYIASATKPLFALSVLLETEKNKLSRDQTLQTMFPTTKFADFDANRVSLNNLLTHTHGLDNIPLGTATAFSGIHNAASRQQMVAVTKVAAEAPYGTFAYSNIGYNLASVWLDQVTKTPWQQHLQTSIFAPLNMQHTSAYISRAEQQKWMMAKPYSAMNSTPDQPLYLTKVDNTMHAAGGVVSTALDLSKFLIAEMNEGKLNGKTKISSSAIAVSQQQQAKTESNYQDFKRDGYTWGWYTGEYKGEQMLHHFGGFAGFHAHLSMLPQKDMALVILNNEDMLSSQLSSLIADYAYGVMLKEADVHDKVTRRFEELNAKAKGIPQMVAKQQSKKARPLTLTQPLERYVGVYKNELLGDFVVSLNEQQKLVLSWGQLNSVATGTEKPDAVRVELVPNSGEVVNFTLEDSNVKSFDYSSMTFNKTP